MRIDADRCAAFPPIKTHKIHLSVTKTFKTKHQCGSRDKTSEPAVKTYMDDYKEQTQPNPDGVVQRCSGFYLTRLESLPLHGVTCHLANREQGDGSKVIRFVSIKLSSHKKYKKGKIIKQTKYIQFF